MALFVQLVVLEEVALIAAISFFVFLFLTKNARVRLAEPSSTAPYAFDYFNSAVWLQPMVMGGHHFRPLRRLALTHPVLAELLIHVAHVNFLSPFLVVQTPHRASFRYSLLACLNTKNVKS